MEISFFFLRFGIFLTNHFSDQYFWIQEDTMTMQLFLKEKR